MFSVYFNQKGIKMTTYVKFKDNTSNYNRAGSNELDLTEEEFDIITMAVLHHHLSIPTENVELLAKVRALRAKLTNYFIICDR